MSYEKIAVPENGQKVTVNTDGALNVPDKPIIPFIKGEGSGVDITLVMQCITDAAVEKAYVGQKAIQWMEIYAGEKANQV